jgi:hypothetical protein
MISLLNSIREAIGGAPADRPICRVCGRCVTARDKCMRLRGGGVVHCRCASYDEPGRRLVSARLGKR